MDKSGASQGQSASELISNRIAELGDWRGETLSTMRKLIKEAAPDVVERARQALHAAPASRFASMATTFALSGATAKRSRRSCSGPSG